MALLGTAATAADQIAQKAAVNTSEGVVNTLPSGCRRHGNYPKAFY